ncbi:unnamed protein product, partial [marine sediment metagenome]
FLHQDARRLASLPPEKRRVLEVFSAIAGAKTGAAVFGSPLIGASIGKKAAKDVLAQMTDKQARRLAFELTTNPEKFVEQVNRLKQGDLTNPGTVLEEMLQIMAKGAKDTAVGAVKAIPGKIPAAIAAERVE